MKKIISGIIFTIVLSSNVYSLDLELGDFYQEFEKVLVSQASEEGLKTRKLFVGTKYELADSYLSDVRETEGPIFLSDCAEEEDNFTTLYFKLSSILTENLPTEKADIKSQNVLINKYKEAGIKLLSCTITNIQKMTKELDLFWENEN